MLAYGIPPAKGNRRNGYARSACFSFRKPASKEPHPSEPEVAPAVSKCIDIFAVRSTDLRRSSMQPQTHKIIP